MVGCCGCGERERKKVRSEEMVEWVRKGKRLVWWIVDGNVS